MKVYWLAMLSAVLWGLAPIFDKLGLVKATPTAAISVRTAAIAAGLGIFLLASGGWREFGSLDRRSMIYIVLGALAAGLVGQYVYFMAMKLGESSKVVPIAATYPLVAAILSVILLREPITPGKVIGSLLIVLGVVAIRLEQVLWPR